MICFCFQMYYTSLDVKFLYFKYKKSANTNKDVPFHLTNHADSGILQLSECDRKT